MPPGNKYNYAGHADNIGGESTKYKNKMQNMDKNCVATDSVPTIKR